MRIRREATAGSQFAAEVLQMLLIESSLQEGARIDTRRGVTLKVNDVSLLVRPSCTEEVIEADFVQRCGRGISRDVPTDATLFAVGSYHHRQRIPAHQTLNAPLDFTAAGINRLLVNLD